MNEASESFDALDRVAEVVLERREDLSWKDNSGAELGSCREYVFRIFACNHRGYSRASARVGSCRADEERSACLPAGLALPGVR